MPVTTAPAGTACQISEETLAAFGALIVSIRESYGFSFTAVADDVLDYLATGCVGVVLRHACGLAPRLSPDAEGNFGLTYGKGPVPYIFAKNLETLTAETIKEYFPIFLAWVQDRLAAES